jgi:hypothetical protein
MHPTMIEGIIAAVAWFVGIPAFFVLCVWVWGIKQW